MAKTARDVAREYCGSAVWVPCDRVMPPEGEEVEVLYKDGATAKASLSGKMFILSLSSMYRYVDPAFWRPVG